jgi:hypothetical protein
MHEHKHAVKLPRGLQAHYSLEATPNQLLCCKQPSYRLPVLTYPRYLSFNVQAVSVTGRFSRRTFGWGSALIVLPAL